MRRFSTMCPLVMENNNYILNLRKLPMGEHAFEYHIDNAFFTALDQNTIEKGTLNLHLQVKKSNVLTELHFDIHGTIYIPCDRCLCEMTQPIDTTYTCFVKFGNATDTADNDDVIFISEDDGTLDVSWMIYETIALAIPTVHTHPEGQCDAAMSAQLTRYMITDDGKPNNNESDPRWDALKHIK